MPLVRKKALEMVRLGATPRELPAIRWLAWQDRVRLTKVNLVLVSLTVAELVSYNLRQALIAEEEA